MTIQEIQLKVLEETVQHYSENPTQNRSKGGGCFYAGQSAGKENDGCAVGRLLPLELRLKLDEMAVNLVCNGFVRDEIIFKELPKEVQELGVTFLSQLQQLHDEDNHWTEQGLSFLGKEKVEQIKKSLNLN